MSDFETIFQTVPQLVATCAVLVVAEAVYVLLGFGAGLIAVGALALLLPELRDVVVLLLLVNLPAELWVVYQSRRAISWRGVFAVFAGIAVGIPIGSWLLEFGRPELLLKLLGLVLVIVGSLFLMWPASAGTRWPRWAVAPVGLTSGLLTGLFGTGGPPLVLYYRISGADKAIFRGQLMAIFLFMTVVRVPSYAAFGLITPTRLWSAAAVLPAVLVGAMIGNHVHLQISEAAFRRVVSGALVAMGLLLMLPGA